MNKPLMVVIPTRGRPGNILKVLDAWDSTDAWNHADMCLAIDGDDPQADEYVRVATEANAETVKISVIRVPAWMPMVPKLNAAAVFWAGGADRFAIGFAGDDHIPRTLDWAPSYLEMLRQMGTGIVYGNDLHHGRNLPTEWAMTADIIRTLGRMVPAPVGHLYCDNSILDLGTEAGCIRYLNRIVIEHMHPIWQKGEWDQQYRDVNSREQYRNDGYLYGQWKEAGLQIDAEKVRKLKESNATASDSGTDLDVQATP